MSPVAAFRPYFAGAPALQIFHMYQAFRLATSFRSVGLLPPRPSVLCPICRRSTLVDSACLHG
eukprot:6212232-Pleurochrysis_carterae.AAC.1